MRGALRSVAVISTLAVGGCGYIFPGFEGLFGLHSYLHDIPVSHITTGLECELRDFLNEPQNKDVLDPDQPASVSIKFQTDQTGTFQYVGIDLNKFGLAPLANLISSSNKIPSLQAKLQDKTTASSQLDLSISQSLKTHTLKRKYVVDPDTGKISLAPPVTIHGLEVVKCDPGRGLLTSLSLGSWLDRFFDNLAREQVAVGNNFQPACMSKITLNTQIVFVFDVSAGVNPLIGTTFILPVSGETFEFNPSATQSLQIVLTLKKFGDDALCTKIPQPQPNRTI
jgi:hypothetical protein